MKIFRRNNKILFFSMYAEIIVLVEANRQWRYVRRMESKIIESNEDKETLCESLFNYIRIFSDKKSLINKLRKIYKIYSNFEQDKEFLIASIIKAKRYFIIIIIIVIIIIIIIIIIVIIIVLLIIIRGLDVYNDYIMNFGQSKLTRKNQSYRDSAIRQWKRLSGEVFENPDLNESLAPSNDEDQEIVEDDVISNINEVSVNAREV
jgi:hypothetical protein